MTGGRTKTARRFTSRILPPYMRRSPKVAEVLPVLYLRGLSTGDFREALAALLGDDAAGLSATNIARLTNEWESEYRAFQMTTAYAILRHNGAPLELGRDPPPAQSGLQPDA